MKYLLIFLAICSYSQQSIKVLYESKRNISEKVASQLPIDSRDEIIKSLTKPVLLELTNNGDVSVVKNEILKEITIPSATTSTSTEIDKGTIIKPFKIWIYKDLKSSSSYSYYTIKNNGYYIKDAPSLKEKLIFDNKTLMIDGYKCKSAMELTAEKDTIQYWYTQDIPVFDGPKQITNIPGLILRYHLKSQTITAIKIEFFDKRLVIEGLNSKIPIITLEEFYKLKTIANKSTSENDGKGTKTKTESKTIKF